MDALGVLRALKIELSEARHVFPLSRNWTNQVVFRKIDRRKPLEASPIIWQSS